MKIGVDVRELSGEKAGKGWYVYHVLKGILELDSKNNYILYCSESIDFPSFLNAKIIIVKKPDLLWHFSVAKRLKNDKIDLYWAPTSPIVPAITNVPSVFTVHDLTNFLFPEMHTYKGKIIDKIYFKRAVLKAKAVLSVSEATKKDLVKFIPESKDKTFVTHLGYDKEFKPLEHSLVHKILAKHDLSPEYVLFVGTVEPRKNIEFLIDAYENLDDDLKKAHPLVIVGKKGWLCEDILKKINSSKNVIYLDYVPFADLPAIYNGCSLFVFPSVYEGFGMPPLEAMACGKPVIVSDISSLPEVVGEAGVKAQMKDPSELTGLINDFLTDKKHAQEFKKKTLKRSALFSWTKTAQKTLAIFNNSGVYGDKE